MTTLSPTMEESYLQDKHDRIVQELEEADKKRFWTDVYLERIDAEIESRRLYPLLEIREVRKSKFSWGFLKILLP